MVIVVLVGYVVTLWAVDTSNDDPASLALASTFEATGTAEADGCYIEPRTIGYITMVVEYAMTGEPEGLHGMPQYDLGEPWPPSEIPDSTSILGDTPEAGAPADDETTSRVTEVFSQYVACFNNHDLLRMYALFTNDGLARRFIPNDVLELGLIAGLSEPPQPGYSQWDFKEFERVEMLPDGRAAGYIAGGSNVVIFKRVDGQWLIDDMNMDRG
jgi:hypothetical protein